VNFIFYVRTPDLRAQVDDKTNISVLVIAFVSVVTFTSAFGGLYLIMLPASVHK